MLNISPSLVFENGMRLFGADDRDRKRVRVKERERKRKREWQ
jgi:hypothetical protein